MKKLLIIFIAFVLSCFATPVMAQDNSDKYRIVTEKEVMKWETGFVVSSALDLAITVQCIEAGKCVEANPLAKSHSTTEMIAIKSVLTLGHYLFVKRLAKRNPKAALRFAQVSVGIQGGVVGLNLATVF